LGGNLADVLPYGADVVCQRQHQVQHVRHGFEGIGFCAPSPISPGGSQAGLDALINFPRKYNKLTN
jgi:hypothetical protein